MRKTLLTSLFGIMCNIGLFALICLANEDISYEEKISYMKSIGCTDEYLASRDENAISRLYEYFIGKNVEFTGTIAVQRDVNENVSKGTIDTDMFTWSLGIFCEQDGNGEMTALNIDIFGRWDTMPLIALEDAVTVNWDGALFKLEYFNSYCSDHYLGYYYESATPALIQSGGIGYNVPLQTGNIVSGNLTNEAMLRLEPREDAFLDGVVYDATITAHYYHQTVGADISFGVSLGVGSKPEYSAGVSVTSGSYDSLGAWANGVFDGKVLRGFTYHDYDDIDENGNICSNETK